MLPRRRSTPPNIKKIDLYNKPQNISKYLAIINMANQDRLIVIKSKLRFRYWVPIIDATTKTNRKLVSSWVPTNDATIKTNAK